MAFVRVTLIHPSMGGRVRSAQLQPLTMAALAGMTPTDVAVSFYDDRVEDIPFDEPTDLAAISVQVFTAKRAYEIAAEYRRRRVPVVLGGFHVTSLPEEGAEHADAIVTGEAEELWPRLMQDARAGRIQRVYRATQRPALKNLTFRRDIFAGKRYLPINLVEFGRGCPHACSFCSIGVNFGHRKICRPVAEVLSEIQALPRKKILFADDNLIGDAKQAKELFRALIPLRVRWIAQAGIELAFDDELLHLAAASGCEGLLVGFESLNEASLRQMRKTGKNTLEKYEEAVRKIHGHGIKICASFVLGCDGDSPEVFNETLAFASEWKFLLAFFNHLTPYPGTPLYEELKSQNRLKYEKWWLAPNYCWGDVVFEPKQFSAEQLSEGCRLSRKRFYSAGSILRRATLQANRKSLIESLALNLMIRNEIREKQGFSLGGQSTTDYLGGSSCLSSHCF